MEPFQGRKARIDGSLGEWPANFEKLDVSITGQGTEASALVGYDDTSLYFALKTNSKSITRKAKPGPGQDHATLEIVFPERSGESGRTHSIDVYPGDPGKVAALVLLDGKELRTAEVVEFERDDGFDLEARLPWSAFSESTTVRVGLKGRISFYEASVPGKMVAQVSTSQKGTSAPLLSEVEAGLVDILVGEKGLRARPAREAYGELTGGGSLERVALYGNILTIVGPDYRGGTEFYLSPLDVNSAEQVQRLELFDFNRDGKDEIVIEKRLSPSTTKYRQVVSVLEVSSEGVPSQIFLGEVGIVTDAGKIQNKVTLSGSNGESSLIIAQGAASGFEEQTFREPTLGDGIPSALLPWGPTSARRYTYRGQKLTLAEETPTKGYKNRAPEKGVSQRPKAAQTSAPAKSTRDPSAAVTAPQLDRVYGLYKKSRGPGIGPVRAEFWQDVAEDERVERIVWQDRDLLVLGDGFQGGTKFAAATLPVKDAKDILNVSLLDVTGEGKLDLVVHAVLHAQAGDALKSQAVVRQVLFVYRVDSGLITQVFATEVGRALGKQQVLGAFRLLDVAGHPTIELLRGRALGFTEETYPFREEPSQKAQSGATIRPLLLPWSTITRRRFSFSAGEFRETT
jgi:hypothetical protein